MEYGSPHGVNQIVRRPTTDKHSTCAMKTVTKRVRYDISGRTEEPNIASILSSRAFFFCCQEKKEERNNYEICKAFIIYNGPIFEVSAFVFLAVYHIVTDIFI